MHEKMGFAPDITPDATSDASGELDNSIDKTAALAAAGLWRSISWQKAKATAEDPETTSEAQDDYPEDEGNWNSDYYDYDEDDSEERLEVRESEMELRQIEIPERILRKYQFITELPSGIGVMGGVARSIARELITGEVEPIRDIDLVEITEDDRAPVDEATKDHLARTYMPDDYQFGHGINSESLEDYFKTRDFTVNQCLVIGQKLIVSDLAYDDFRENIIRPTFYEVPFTTSKISSRLFLKALMMRAAISQFSESVPLLEDVEVDAEYVGSFDMALMLNKAMSRSVDVAVALTEDYADWDLIPEHLAGKPMKTATNLLEDVWGFEFHPSGDGRFDQSSHNSADASKATAQRLMQEYHSPNPSIQKRN